MLCVCSCMRTPLKKAMQSFLFQECPDHGQSTTGTVAGLHLENFRRGGGGQSIKIPIFLGGGGGDIYVCT